MCVVKTLLYRCWNRVVSSESEWVSQMSTSRRMSGQVWSGLSSIVSREMLFTRFRIVLFELVSPLIAERKASDLRVFSNSDFVVSDAFCVSRYPVHVSNGPTTRRILLRIIELCRTFILQGDSIVIQ